MDTLTYNNKVTLTVNANDNELTCILNPDGPNAKTATVYHQYQNYMGQSATTVADLTPYLNDILSGGGSTVLSAIASNYSGGGTMSFTVTTDTGGSWSPASALGTYTSQQWAVNIKKA